VTTVDESVQPASTPLSDPERSGVVRTAAGPVAWAAVGRAGAPVALLLPATDDLWGWPRPFVAALVAHGLPVVAVAAPPEAADDALTVADACVAALVAAGGMKAHVIGASQGGIVAQAMAAAHPARVASLTLLMTRRPTGAPIDVGPDLLSVLAPARGGGPLLDRAIEAAAAVGRRWKVDPASVRARAAIAEAAGADTVTGLLAFASGEDPSVPPAASGVPAVVFHGADDQVVAPDAGRRLAQALDAELIVVPTGHDLPWGHEEEVAARVAALAAEVERRPWRSRRERGRPNRKASAALVIAVLMMLGLLAASTIDVPYYAISPGSARRTNDLVEVPADRRHPPKGELLFVTVGLGRLKALQWVLATRDPDVEVVPEREILGDTPEGEYRQQVTQEMVDAKESAAVVALNRICERVVERGTGARVEQVVEGSPAAAAGLVKGDVVTAVDGNEVMTADQALNLLRSKVPGAPLDLKVTGPTEGAQLRSVTATLAARPEDPARSFLGVTLRTRQKDFTLPFEVSIDSGRVGGPSAGLEFALSILDQLTPGELTGGRKVAVTGTIQVDGTVGAVGGVPQKTVTVRRAGAKLFLVPKSQVEEARTKAGDSIEVVGVDTLDEAIAALGARGGDISGIPGSCPGP
jgi:PDZ domain-containing protein